jgi:hypothetical protein
MKKLLQLEEDNEKSFYVMNDWAEYWSGLKLGKAAFSDNFEDARTLERDTQFKTLQILSDYPIEKIYL